MYAMTAAHKTLPLPAYVQVTNLRNGRSVIVRVNDRGPFKDGRIIDLSYTAAAKLDMLRDGTTFVEVRALTPEQKAAPPAPPQNRRRCSSRRARSAPKPMRRRLLAQLRAQGVDEEFRARGPGQRPAAVSRARRPDSERQRVRSRRWHA